MSSLLFCQACDGNIQGGGSSKGRPNFANLIEDFESARLNLTEFEEERHCGNGVAKILCRVNELLKEFSSKSHNWSGLVFLALALEHF